MLLSNKSRLSCSHVVINKKSLLNLEMYFCFQIIIILFLRAWPHFISCKLFQSQFECECEKEEINSKGLLCLLLMSHLRRCNGSGSGEREKYYYYYFSIENIQYACDGRCTSFMCAHLSIRIRIRVRIKMRIKVRIRSH